MKLIFKLLRWLAWPIFRILLHNTHRSRVLIRCGDEILLVRGRLESLSGDTAWSLPGGGKHRKEDLASGAIREVSEEVGIAITPEQLWPIGEIRLKERGIAYQAHFYEASITEKASPKIQRLEIARADWFRSKDLIKQPLKPDVLYALGHLLKR